MKLSILICTVPKREDFLRSLLRELRGQIKNLNAWDDVEILSEPNVLMSIGKKRNFLLDIAEGDYVAFVDDDDRVSRNYLKLLMRGINGHYPPDGIDCCSLLGEITEDGKNPLLFEHSIQYTEYRTNPDTTAPIRYERYPNHLNCIKSSIAKQFFFPEKNHGEDTDWATQIHNSGLLKVEHYIPEIIYYYDWRSKKPELA